MYTFFDFSFRCTNSDDEFKRLFLSSSFLRNNISTMSKAAYARIICLVSHKESMKFYQCLLLAMISLWQPQIISFIIQKLFPYTLKGFLVHRSFSSWSIYKLICCWFLFQGSRQHIMSSVCSTTERVVEARAHNYLHHSSANSSSFWEIWSFVWCCQWRMYIPR